MAKIDILAPFILSYEGGYGNDPADKGGPTNRGVTLATWRMYGYDKNGDGKIDEKDVRLISEKDATNIMKKRFWDVWLGDQIKDQSLANTLVDWLWASGKWGIIRPQRLLGVKADGIVGPKTLAALNAQDPEKFFAKIKEDRKRYITEIVNSSVRKYEKKIGRKATYKEKMKWTNQRFQNGWLRRLNGIGYGWLKDSYGKVTRF